MSPVLAGIDPSDFDIVVDYLNGKPVQDCLTIPKNAITGIDHATFLVEQLRRAAMTGDVANKLGIHVLERAASDTVDHIASRPTVETLRVVEYFSTRWVLNNGFFRRFCVKCLTKWFWMFAKVDDGTLRDILAVDSRLTREVLDIVALDIAAGGKKDEIL